MIQFGDPSSHTHRAADTRWVRYVLQVQATGAWAVSSGVSSSGFARTVPTSMGDLSSHTFHT